MNRFLPCLGNKGVSFYSNDVSNVQKFFKHGIVHCLVLSWADLVSFNIHLNPACIIHKFNECSSTHNPAAHYSAGNADIFKTGLSGLVILSYLSCCSVYRIKGSRIRLNPKLSHLRKGIPPVLFLFV